MKTHSHPHLIDGIAAPLDSVGLGTVDPVDVVMCLQIFPPGSSSDPSSGAVGFLCTATTAVDSIFHGKVRPPVSKKRIQSLTHFLRM